LLADKLDLISSILFCSISSSIVALSRVRMSLRPDDRMDPVLDMIGLRFKETFWLKSYY
jgi:hypothetical protein